MKFIPTPLAGAWIIQPQRHQDLRGYFARTFCQEEFAGYGIAMNLVQCSTSFNVRAGTLRGMHLQLPPHAEAKLVRCTRGALYDVIIDLRPASPTYRQWTGVTLTAENGLMLYIPEGFAHGFQTLAEATEVFYQMNAFYHPESARGVRFDDPAFNITWPLADMIVSDKDRTYPDYHAENLT